MSAEPEGAQPLAIFAPLTAGATDRITEAIERLKKVPARFKWTDGSGNILIDHEVQKAIKIDPTGLTAAMMVEARAKEFGGEITFTATEVLNMTEKDREMLRNLQTITSLTKDPEIDEPLKAFERALRAAAEQYDLWNAKVEQVIGDRTKLAHIRTSALWCMDNFEVHQFNQGGPSRETFHYNRFIYEFNNINSAIRITATQPLNGVTMALIRDPEIEAFSYFIFILRSGENITVLTDRPEFDNPEQKYIRRNPGRDLEHRLDSNWFPYGILNIEVDDRGHLYIPKDRSMGKLVTYQTEAIRVCGLEKTTPEEIVWALLMFDLITQRYHRENRHVKELSYTGEMLETPLALHAGTQLSLRNYKTLAVPDLTLADLDTAATRKQFEVKPTEFNRWMEERYGSQVNPELFKVLEKPDPKTLLLANTADGKALTPFTGKDRRFMRSDEQPVNYEISHLPPETFGTRKQILKDYKWVGRKNLAESIQALADEEYEREKQNVIDWYRRAVRKNAPALRRAIVEGKFEAPELEMRHTVGFRAWTEKDIEPRNILKTMSVKASYSDRGHQPLYCHHNGGWSQQSEALYCIEKNDTLASTLAYFRPTTPAGIAALAGVEVSALPVWLQHWFKEAPYHGNQILRDVDPMECIHNPWMNQHWRHDGFYPVLVIAFCKAALRKWKRERSKKPFPAETEIAPWVRKLSNKAIVVHKKSRKRFYAYTVKDDLWRLRATITWRQRYVSLEDLSRKYEPEQKL